MFNFYEMKSLVPVLLLAVLVSLACSGNQSSHESQPQEIQLPSVAYSDLELRGDLSNQVAYYNGAPFSGMSIIYTSGGVKHIEQEYKDGHKAGKWRVYFTSGQLEKEGQKVNDTDHGTYKEWYFNGNLKYQYEYNNGLKNGKWLSWYADGTRYTERNFVNDQLHGKVLVWDEQGKLSKEYDYVNGQLVNSQMHFKENK